MDEFKLAQQQGKGVQAESLLSNPLLQEVFAALEKEYIEGCLKTAAKDTQARERLWQAIHIGRIYQEHMRRYIENGKLATRDLAQIKYLKR